MFFNSKMTSKTFFIAVTASLFFQSAWANPLKVNHAWVRPTAPGQTVAGAYMDITARDAARLVGVRSPISSSVQIHWMQMEGDMMRMREVAALDLPKNKTVSLQPGGYHLMLMKLKKPINSGEKIPLTLVIETKGKRHLISIEVLAQSNPTGASKNTHDHMHH